MRDLPTTEYDLLALLDRLEDMHEDMEEFGLSTRAEVEALMSRVRERLDALDPPAQS